jgi:hypothetical protein
MRLIFLTISVILAVPLVECRELRSDSLSIFLIEEILKPSSFPSSPTKGLPSPSLASGPTHQPSHQSSGPTTTLSSSEASYDAASELAFVQLVKLGPTQSTNPTNAPLSVVDQLSQREDIDVSENLNYSWNSSTIAIVAVGGVFLSFILLATCGSGYDNNDEHSTGTACITLCPSTDEEFTYQSSNPLSPSPYRCSVEVVMATEYDENISCGVVSAQPFEDFVDADYDDNRVDVVAETENDENIYCGVVSTHDVVEAEHYETRGSLRDQPASLSRTLTPVPEEASVDYGRDEMSEFSV